MSTIHVLPWSVATFSIPFSLTNSPMPVHDPPDCGGDDQFTCGMRCCTRRPCPAGKVRCDDGVGCCPPPPPAAGISQYFVEDVPSRCWNDDGETVYQTGHSSGPFLEVHGSNFGSHAASIDVLVFTDAQRTAFGRYAARLTATGPSWSVKPSLSWQDSFCGTGNSRPSWAVPAGVSVKDIYTGKVLDLIPIWLGCSRID